MKLCKDCKHVRVDGLHPVCARAASTDPVTGEPDYAGASCSYQRDGLAALGNCGWKGRYWEPKETDNG